MMMMKKMEKLAYSEHRKIVTTESMMRIDINLNLSKPAVVVRLGTFLAAGNKKPNSAKEEILSHSPLPDRGISNSFIVHQFISCAHQAFDQHIGFVLAPQQLFLLILQQIALHVNQNAQELRAQFVRHEGKKDLVVDVPMNPTVEQWAGAMQSIRQQIGENTVPDTLQLFSLQEFSTISENEKIAGDIALMDTCQEFFSYRFRTLCGIPFFILEGTVEDWESLREKAEQIIVRKTLPEFSARWLPALLPTLDKIIKARKGEENDKAFWESFYKRDAQRGSGGCTFVSGWINCFFPLTQTKFANPFCEAFSNVPLYLKKIEQLSSISEGTIRTSKEGEEEQDDDNRKEGMDKADFPSGFSTVPVTWHRLGEEIPLKVNSGFICGIYNEDERFIRPEVGWWITSSKQ
jgi:hypothetical protein